MEEQWKDIEGLEGKYQISNKGRVKSMRRPVREGSKKYIEEKIRKVAKDRGGYLFLKFMINGKFKTCLIHRLVANAFIPNPDNLPEVNHKDENKENNCVEKLEWCDRKYNIRYGTAIKRAREKTSKKVIRCDKEWNELKIYNSVEETREDGFEPKHVSDCALGKRKTHGGFKWKYVNE